MAQNIKETLNERGNNYGNFHTHANLAQTLTKIINQHYTSIHSVEGQPMVQLPNFMAEAIHMICHKLARIVNGNPYYADSWHDIAGYSELVVGILENHEKELAASKMVDSDKQKADPVN